MSLKNKATAIFIGIFSPIEYPILYFTRGWSIRRYWEAIKFGWRLK